MKQGILIKLGLLLASAVFLVGCKTFSSSSTSSDEAYDGGLETGGAGAYGSYSGRDLTPEEAAQLRQTDVIYFDFDSSRIPPDDLKVIEAHAYYLVQNPNARVRVEGHTDARGSREYNIALGERRAQAVARALYLAGAKNDQVVVVSYGAEKPVRQGNDEAAWRYNRRAEIVYEVK